MSSSRERTARDGVAGTPDSQRRERALAVVTMGSRGLLWAVLTVSMFGTVLTAGQLQSPWGVLLPPVCALGGIAAGLAAVYRFFFACLGALSLIRFTLRPGGPSREIEKQSNTPEQAV